MTRRDRGKGRRRDGGRGRCVDPYARRRLQFARVLDALGPEVRRAFEAMPRACQEVTWKLKHPGPLIEFDLGLDGRIKGRWGRAERKANHLLREDVTASVRSATITIRGHEIPVMEAFSIIRPLLGLANTNRRMAERRAARDAGDLTDEAGRAAEDELPRELPRELPPPVRRFAEALLPAVTEAFTQCNEGLAETLYFALRPALARHARHDTRHLSVTFDASGPPDGVQRIELRVRAHPARAHRVRLARGESPRRLYELAEPFGPPEAPLTWLRWKATARPVLATSHALRNLRQRLAATGAGPDLDALLAYNLRPRVLKVAQTLPDGQELVPLVAHVHAQDRRLGYLLVSHHAPDPALRRLGFHDGVSVLRTFLFLTMVPSPEARLLEKHARLGRADIDHLRLAELETFLHGDLGDDPALRKLLTRCGCGHLLDLSPADKASGVAERRPVAAALRRHLEADPRRARDPYQDLPAHLRPAA